MIYSISKIRSDPVLARAIPFLLFIAFLMANSVLAPLAASIGISLSWLAVIRGVIVALVLAWFWRSYTELRNTEVVSATHWLVSIGAGIAVFVVWIELGESGR
jgi:VIT1/CCC1 family predicted Fe2+/Mn2+ transporter